MTLLEQFLGEWEDDEVESKHHELLMEFYPVFDAASILLEFEQQFADYDRDLPNFDHLNQRMEEIKSRFNKILKAEQLVKKLRDPEQAEKQKARLDDHKKALGILWNETKEKVAEADKMIAHIMKKLGKQPSPGIQGRGVGRQRIGREVTPDAIVNGLRYVQRTNPETDEVRTLPILFYLHQRRFVNTDNGRLRLNKRGLNYLRRMQPQVESFVAESLKPHLVNMLRDIRDGNVTRFNPQNKDMFALFFNDYVDHSGGRLMITPKGESVLAQAAPTKQQSAFTQDVSPALMKRIRGIASGQINRIDYKDKGMMALMRFGYMDDEGGEPVLTDKGKAALKSGG